MTSQLSEALAAMIKRGIRFRVDGDELKVSAPIGAVSERDKTALRSVKNKLLDRIKSLQADYNASLARMAETEALAPGNIFSRPPYQTRIEEASEAIARAAEELLNIGYEIAEEEFLEGFGRECGANCNTQTRKPRTGEAGEISRAHGGASDRSDGQGAR